MGKAKTGNKAKGEDVMNIRQVVGFGLAAMTISMGSAFAQVNPEFVIGGAASEGLHDRIAINADTARRIAEACEAIARENNSRVVVVVLNPYGLTIHQHAMDGEGYVSINAAQQKALTALRTRRPTVILANRNHNNEFTENHMYGYELTVQEGGLPIIADGQLIGAMGVGGIPPAHRNSTYDEDKCGIRAIEAVIGTQPAIPDNIEAEAWENRPGPAAP
jgi:uncharacterized protein GlcG (DUF336 family)